MDKRVALTVPLDGYTLAEHADLVREAERLGYRDVWSWEADGLDAFSPLAVAALGTGLRLGTAIVNVFTRGPATLAQCAAGLAEMAPGRFILGIGSGSNVIVEAWNGGVFRRPATRVREMAQFLRRALAGERVVFKGETFQVDGFRLTRPPARPVPIYVAALRPGMLRVAGEVGDGVILNWLSPEDVPRCVSIVREAAKQAGRDPAAIEITARLFVYVERTPALGPMWQAWSEGDRKAAVAAIPERVLDELVLRGSAEAIRARVRRYLEAGIDTAFLSIQTGAADLAQRREIVRRALPALAPGG
ncbi:MAG TPA: LLM class flavin-dependent oxidoreductase [Candidatus Binatia bacterium]|nr:LLM class flavin-dependent oxidoreductase [Candidatus Binatia bacterium]